MDTLSAYVQGFIQKPYELGVQDCGHFIEGWGVSNGYAPFVVYTDQASFFAHCNEVGGIEARVSETLNRIGLVEISVDQARRGDIGLLEYSHDGKDFLCFVLCLGASWVGRAHGGGVISFKIAPKRAWRLKWK